MSAALVWCPFPDADSARVAADALLDDALIACANILGAIESRFVWEGARATGSEVGVLFKTTAERLEPLRRAVMELHSYDTPEWLSWPVEASQDYGSWAAASCCSET